ncbi:MAG: cupin domain-containing protein [Rhodopseudomonas sp.]|nr:cupin domain-containing protein [Rhodopseudomonas sp.]
MAKKASKTSGKAGPSSPNGTRVKIRDKAAEKAKDKAERKARKAAKRAARKAEKKLEKKLEKKAGKSAQPRKAANRKADTRRAVTTQTRAKKRSPQRFTVSHLNEADFDQGLRRYAQYRDLGLALATGGMVQAHVIRFIPPFRPEDVSTPHFHDVELQMIYVLKGWYKTEFEGEGVHTFHAGACWLQPPRIKHTVLGYSDDCELLEIVLPAEFETVTLAD